MQNSFFENKHNDSIGKPLCLPNKTSVRGRDALNVKNTVKFETKSTLGIFKNFNICYGNLHRKNLKKYKCLLTCRYQQTLGSLSERWFTSYINTCM